MKIKCPKCKRVYDVEKEMSGEFVKCECGEEFKAIATLSTSTNSPKKVMTHTRPSSPNVVIVQKQSGCTKYVMILLAIILTIVVILILGPCLIGGAVVGGSAVAVGTALANMDTSKLVTTGGHTYSNTPENKVDRVGCYHLATQYLSPYLKTYDADYDDNGKTMMAIYLDGSNPHDRDKIYDAVIDFLSQLPSSVALRHANFWVIDPTEQIVVTIGVSSATLDDVVSSKNIKKAKIFNPLTRAWKLD